MSMLKFTTLNNVKSALSINNVRQLRKNVVIFNVELHNFDQHQTNAVNMIIFKKLKRAKKIFLSFENLSD